MPPERTECRKVFIRDHICVCFAGLPVFFLVIWCRKRHLRCANRTAVVRL